MRNGIIPILVAALAPASFLVACGDARPWTSQGGSAQTSCASCHGTPGRTGILPGTDPDLAAAPPVAVASADAVGAHLAHLNPPATGLRGPLPCGSCHNPVPTDYQHFIQPPQQIVVFGGLALGPVDARAGTNPGTPRWRGANGAPTCSNVYCHGSFSWNGSGQGGTNVTGTLANAPDWTKTGQAECGSCHGLPPTNHIQSPSIVAGPGGAATCNGCHPGTVDPGGNIIVDAATGTSLHINGSVDEGAHADPSWCVLSSPFGQSAGCAPESATSPAGGTHTLAALDFTPPGTGLQGCLGCHSVGGVSFGSADGKTTSSCNDCHASLGAASWLTSCTFCHGTAGRTGNVAGTDAFLAAAPPRGVRGETDPGQLAVGAHQAHVNPAGGSGQLSNPFPCTACHNPMPPAAPHPSGATSLVAFGGIAVPAGTTAPTYDPVKGCAATYCHGNWSPGGNDFTPVWNQGATQGACGTCHGLPPPTGRVVQLGGGTPSPLHVLHVNAGLNCGNCHPGYAFSIGPVNLALHVNGTVDVGNNVTQWNPATGACVGCHGSDQWL
jgi:predicted CxxxxCH...CXXCH cytochrome family protein